MIGAGTNRMNIYTVRKATQGLANYINKAGKAAQGVAIAFDSRHMSPNLQMRRHFAWQQMELRRMCLNLFVQHQSFPMQCVN